jgi:hypothetical protein
MATQPQNELMVERLRSAPLKLLRPSVLVDFVLFLACEKPAVRLMVDNKDGFEALGKWCRQWGFDFAADEEDFACVSSEPGTASRVLEIDRRAYAHEIELGRALGYPACCCERVAEVGESEIDSYALVVEGWSFEGPYRRINPAGYRLGRALISHLPCSPTCEASLAIADGAYRFVVENAGEPALSELYRALVVSA